MADPSKYTSAEISAATGIKRSVVLYRGKTCGIKFPCTYEQTKQIVSYHGKRRTYGPRKSAVDKLKMQLKNDGYKVVDK